MSNTLRTLLPLAVIVSILIGYNFISAQWTPAPGAPTGGNTAAPINVSALTQAKTGNLAANIVAATTQMRSNQYCDAMGGNCISHADMVTVINNASTTPTPSCYIVSKKSATQCLMNVGAYPVAQFCEAGWVQVSIEGGDNCSIGDNDNKRNYTATCIRNVCQ